MENKEKEIVLKPKKKSLLVKLNELFADSKKRKLYIVLFVLPFVLAIGVFGFVAFKEAKSLIDLARGSETVNKENIIESMKYVLRDNATDVQKEYFAELKQAVEVDNASDEIMAGLVCKNYVADFYTWTNKQGQYDISALYYVYGPQKNDIYLQARDGFYKYLNNYINDYGASNLIEVESVDVVKSSFVGHEYETATGEVFDDVIGVTCNWTYKVGSKLDTSKYAKSMNFLVAIRDYRYEIIEASTSPIVFEQVESEVTTNEE